MTRYSIFGPVPDDVDPAAMTGEQIVAQLRALGTHGNADYNKAYWDGEKQQIAGIRSLPTTLVICETTPRTD